jgi:hypothetical protein
VPEGRFDQLVEAPRSSRRTARGAPMNAPQHHLPVPLPGEDRGSTAPPARQLEQAEHRDSAE